jgi:hypothetical protein
LRGFVLAADVDGLFFVAHVVNSIAPTRSWTASSKEVITADTSTSAGGFRVFASSFTRAMLMCPCAPRRESW